MNEEARHSYAHLPEDLILKILQAVPASVDKMNAMFNLQDTPMQAGMDLLREQNLIKQLGESATPVDSLMAVDGGNIIERMSGTDILLAVAVGVEGLSENTQGWSDGNQYYQWQTVMPHDEATPRLCQGVMFLMELSVLADAPHEIRIMDGTHFTPLLKINSMLSAKEENAGKEYAQALRDFLRETYDKVIPNIPDIIATAFGDDRIIAIAKYSSSKDILDAYVKNSDITVDDKTFFTLKLREGEYTKPMTVGQSGEERRKIWDDLHIHCNLDIPEREVLNIALKNAIAGVRTRAWNGKERKQSEICYTYYKPHENGVAYRIECKESLAKNAERFENMLMSLRKQIIYPDIREPFPQYLADLMAKSVAGGLSALQDAIRLSSDLSIDKGRFDLLFPYRSR